MRAATIDWILFDADGVLQQAREGWLEALTATGGVRGEEFVLAVFAAEKACLGFITSALGVSGDRVLFLDDHEANVLGARAAGLAAELFPRGGGVAALERILEVFGLSLTGDVVIDGCLS